MTTEIEDLLAEAADDTGLPMRHSIDDVVRRGKRGVRARRAGMAAASVITSGALVIAISSWPGGGGEGIAPAVGPSVTIGTRTGKPATGQQPTASSLTDAQIISRCKVLDREFVQTSSNKAGGGTDALDDWSVVIAQGRGQWFRAILVSPDDKRFAYCQDNSGSGAPYDDYYRQSVDLQKPFEVWSDRDGSKGEVSSDVARLTFLLPDGTASDAVIKDGFFLWTADLPYSGVNGKPIWAIFYDWNGREIARFDSNPHNPAVKQPSCGPNQKCEPSHIAPRTPIYPK